MSEGADTRVVAVVVSFEPDAQNLARLLDALTGQVAHTVVVDNGSASDVAAVLGTRSDASLIALPQNRGIATAQNLGIADAKARSADYVILFDQDSLPGPSMVRDLVRGARSVAAATLAAVGPTPVDNRQRKLNWSGPHGDSPQVVEVEALIASGCLVPMAAFEQVGPLRDALFIDMVDTEWCLRARSQGLACYMDLSVPMQHEFGDVRQVLGIRFTSRVPVRHYYMVRNFIWLMRQRRAPLSWKLRALPSFALRQIVSATFAAPRGARWQMVGRGIRDGIGGRTGRLDVRG